jgi:hypothetical protein
MEDQEVTKWDRWSTAQPPTTATIQDPSSRDFNPTFGTNPVLKVQALWLRSIWGLDDV